MKQLLICVFLVCLYVSCTGDDKKSTISPDLEEQVSRKIDGPYIMHEELGLRDYRIDSEGHLQMMDLKDKKDIEVVAPRIEPQYFTFDIQDTYQEEGPGHNLDNPTLFVTSDIEGNFYAFVQLLIGNGVTDQDLNWSFGDNHLVLVGDMVDRGSFVIQVLWLIYKLEQQAKAAGGDVHFVLGNHDIMCMEGDYRYAVDKYLDVAQKMGIEYKELYGLNSEIGRWMRTKNSIEKIGDYLFVHGGISPDVINLNLSIEEINEKVKPYYGKEFTNSTPLDVRTLYGNSGIYWYRGYVKEKEGEYVRASQKHVDDVLNYYGAKSIIVGHCVVDVLKTEYGGSVVTVDVIHPANAYSTQECQALLIEGGKMYRVNEKAERIELR